jgi:neutral amino acid transport system permease protein
MTFWFLFEFLDGVMTGAVLNDWFFGWFEATDIGPIRFALFGVGLMWLMIFRPQGLFGSHEEMLIDAQ